MLKFERAAVPTNTRGNNPFMDVAVDVVADFKSDEQEQAVRFVAEADKKLVGTWGRQWTEAVKAADPTLMARKLIEPKVSTATTPGVDDKAERTVTFWVTEKDNRGNRKQKA